MSKKEKLIRRLLTVPKDFTFDELVTLMKHLGFKISTKGKTSGSRIGFWSAEYKHIHKLHKPHGGKVLKEYQIKDLIYELKKVGILNEKHYEI